MNDYESKQESKRQRLLDAAERAERKAAAHLDSAHNMGSVIPMGQPILIGHHSESRDRNYRKRIENNYRKSMEASDHAKELRGRAASVGQGGVSSDDPDAVTKLKETLKVREDNQALMKAANKAIRKGDDQALNDLGFDDATIIRLKTPDFCGRLGFADYQLKNNNANIRRIKQRIAELETADTDPGGSLFDKGEIQVIDNADDNRVQVYFPGKPSAEIRQALKSNGFRWAPSVGAWQRHRSNAARYHAVMIAKRAAELTS